MLVLTIFVVLRKRDSTLTTTASGSAYLFLVYADRLEENKLQHNKQAVMCAFCVFILLLRCCFCVFAVVFFKKPFSGWIFLFGYRKKDDVWCLSWVTLRILFSSPPVSTLPFYIAELVFMFGPWSRPDIFSNAFPMAALLCALLLCWN